jgi:hypothetical protein
MELDHVLFAVADLAAAATEFESRYGLGSVQGGRHDGWGTANRIVPLGDEYLELVAVVDEDEAASSVFGRWVASGHSGRPLGWAVRTNGLDTVVQRLNLTVRPGSRPTSDRGLLHWRMAGIEQAAAEPMLPFLLHRTRSWRSISGSHRRPSSGGRDGDRTGDRQRRSGPDLTLARQSFAPDPRPTRKSGRRADRRLNRCRVARPQYGFELTLERSSDGSSPCCGGST